MRRNGVNKTELFVPRSLRSFAVKIESERMNWTEYRIHIMGIGGAGMSAIARLLHARGVRVSGDDRADSPVMQQLRDEGIPVLVGHDPAHLDGVEVLAPSSAIAKDEPELVEAKKRG